MFTHYYTEGVILARRPMRDADEVFTFFTKDFGKIEVTGRSIRKNNSKLRMNTDTFSHVEIGFIQGKSYNTLTDATCLSSFKDAKKSLGKTSLFYRISELVLALVYGQEKDERVYFFLLNSFQKVDKETFSKNSLRLFYCFFSLNLLYFLGHRMYIEKCVFCGKPIKKECYFDPKEGGVTCKDCFSESRFGVYLESVDVLRCFFRPDLKKILQQDPKVCMNILESYLSFVPELQKKN